MMCQDNIFILETVKSAYCSMRNKFFLYFSYSYTFTKLYYTILSLIVRKEMQFFLVPSLEKRMQNLIYSTPCSPINNDLDSPKNTENKQHNIMLHSPFYFTSCFI